MHAHADPAVMQGPAHGALIAAAGFQADDGARRRRVFAEKGDQLGKAGFVIGELPRRAHAAKPNIEGGLGNIDADNGNKKWHTSRVPAFRVRAYRPWQLSGRTKGRAVTRLPHDGPRTKHEASEGERSAARAGGGACPTPSGLNLYHCLGYTRVRDTPASQTRAPTRPSLNQTHPHQPPALTTANNTRSTRRPKPAALRQPEASRRPHQPKHPRQAPQNHPPSHRNHPRHRRKRRRPGIILHRQHPLETRTSAIPAAAPRPERPPDTPPA